MSQDQRYYRLAMKIFADFGISIAVPAVLAALLGSRMDTHFGTGSLFLVIFLVCALVFTAIIVYRKARVYEKMYSALIQKEEKKS
ncbi:MAG: hypothetical protein UU08_C0008G0021 [Candidatus Uhrbacteria bacterium GW2011_GWE2_40_58]|nr:MAG: hypothetical protein UT94_C0008G0021 [Candidatus Uhrbacteria bacterium GW2011_GWF2_40_263]KKR67815.1 MAG: hypothetical protein UU08_C0008G0021 [Candidatus Uhrbacteria bacterium GW2011_GWE2_40_58]OGL94522.1 MAG: hypothetical protein A2239_00545 [Candidatus Uhrbacteria bacterium RIFOXYA2_FULL_40_9]OGL96773.1 MAG: hypothetical protein A2332_04520 [Candidatus Uhrbacteria bacterium RIFOXYB2_FULL_41_18]HBK34489.1 hypothetical protein [Candidatus Uhrbacteria bacterium]